MKSKSVYALSWIVDYFLNRKLFIILTLLVSIFILGYCNTIVCKEVQPLHHVVKKMEQAKYINIGITNHSNYEGENFYQLLNDGFFYSQKDTDGYTGKIDAIAIKELPNRTYTKNVSPILQYNLIKGKMPSKENEVVISENTAKRYGLTIGSNIFYFSMQNSNRMTFVVSGILEDFYGIYNIDTHVNSGLIFIHNNSMIESSTFLHFFDKSTDATYSRLYLKQNDLMKLKTSIQNVFVKYVLISIFFVFAFFVVLHTNIKKYINRLKQENCGKIDIFLFIFCLVFVILSMAFGVVTLKILLFHPFSSVTLKAMAIEYFATLLFIAFFYSIVFLPRRHLK